MRDARMVPWWYWYSLLHPLEWRQARRYWKRLRQSQATWRGAVQHERDHRREDYLVGSGKYNTDETVVNENG